MNRHAHFIRRLVKINDKGTVRNKSYATKQNHEIVMTKNLEFWRPFHTDSSHGGESKFPATNKRGRTSHMPNLKDRLFDFFSDGKDRLSVQKFKDSLSDCGLCYSDPRLKKIIQKLENVQKSETDEQIIDRMTFKDCIADNVVLIAKAFYNDFIIPDFKNFKQQINELYLSAKSNANGSVANYIPQLSTYSPDLWGISICTIDGQRYSIGDCKESFCLQSSSKPLLYTLAQDELGHETVHKYVGYEPSGMPFNEITVNSSNKPHNPMINAGAIVTCSLLKQNMKLEDRLTHISEMFKRLAGGEHLDFNNKVFSSEKQTADRNFALGYYLKEKKCFPQEVNLMETMDFYFHLCSVEVNCESASVIAATLANGGVCPLTCDLVSSRSSVWNTLSLMDSCGMYDYSGRFALEVGLPAKSGVSGCILLVVPNVMGICLWSPSLDIHGNSVRGIQFCQELVKKFKFHKYDSLIHSQGMGTKGKTENNLLFCAYNGDIAALERYASLGTNMNSEDYDGKTALHVGATEGHHTVVRFLLDKCNVKPFPKDRWGRTPLDYAKQFQHEEVLKIYYKYLPEDSQNETSDA